MIPDDIKAIISKPLLTRAEVDTLEAWFRDGGWLFLVSETLEINETSPAGERRFAHNAAFDWERLAQPNIYAAAKLYAKATVKWRTIHEEMFEKVARGEDVTVLIEDTVYKVLSMKTSMPNQTEFELEPLGVGTWECTNHAPGSEIKDIPVGDKCPICR